jgi:hypothetical protein
MSVRATKRLIGDTVKATNLPNSPLMVVQSVNEEESTATTIWFTDCKRGQTGVFPVSALDRAEHKPTAAKKPAAKKPARKKK